MQIQRAGLSNFPALDLLKVDEPGPIMNVGFDTDQSAMAACLSFNKFLYFLDGVFHSLASKKRFSVLKTVISRPAE